jgi:hypothetical protein
MCLMLSSRGCQSNVIQFLKFDMKHILIVLLVIPFIIFSSCKKPKQKEYVEMIFEIPLNITPIKDTFNVGDSLLLEAYFSDSIKEINTNKYYKLENFDFKTVIGFYILPNGSENLYLSQQEGSSSSFSFFNIKGGIENIGQTFSHLDIEYKNSIYMLKSYIIARQRGVFTISLFSRYVGYLTNLNSLDLGINSNGDQKIALLKNIWYTINEGNTNVELLKKHSKLVSTSTNPDRENIQSEQKGTFTFVVN